MRPTTRRAHLHAEFYRHNTLWTGAEVLRNLGNTPDGGLYARLAATLFAYLAFEGLLNHLGEGLFPEDWKNEKSLFSKAPFKGTLGKLSFIAARCGLTVHRGSRPYSTLKALDKQRSALVHSRTERRTKTVVFADARRIPQRLESELAQWVTDRALARVFDDVKAMASTLVGAARSAHPRAMQHVYGAGFTGAIGSQGGHIEP